PRPLALGPSLWARSSSRALELRRPPRRASGSQPWLTELDDREIGEDGVGDDDRGQSPDQLGHERPDQPAEEGGDEEQGVRPRHGRGEGDDGGEHRRAIEKRRDGPAASLSEGGRAPIEDPAAPDEFLTD